MATTAKEQNCDACGALYGACEYLRLGGRTWGLLCSSCAEPVKKAREIRIKVQTNRRMANTKNFWTAGPRLGDGYGSIKRFTIYRSEYFFPEKKPFMVSDRRFKDEKNESKLVGRSTSLNGARALIRKTLRKEQS